MSYGFILQREKVTGTLVSAYIAIVVTELLGPYIGQFFAGEAPVGSLFITANPAPFAVNIAIFVGIIILLTTRAGLAGMRGGGLLSPVEIIAYSALNSAIILSTILFYLDESTRATLANDSYFVSILIKYHDLWLILPAILLVVMGIRNHKKHGHYGS